MNKINILRGMKLFRPILTMGIIIIIGCGCSGETNSSGDKTDITNTKPTALIVAPSNIQIFSYGQSITFTGIGDDTEDGNLSGGSLIWVSSLDGQINTGTTFDKDDLSAGTHTITLSVTDSAGQTESHSIEIIVQANNAPTAKILIPRDGRIYPHYYSVPFYGIANDIEDGTLSGMSMYWESNIDGSGARPGAISGLRMPQSTGEHKITLTATDSAGAISEDSVTIPVEKYPYSINEILVSGNYAYFSDLLMGFGVIDVSNPAKPHLVNIITIPFKDIPVLSLIDNFVYFYDGANLRIIDISEPPTPNIVRTIEIISPEDIVDSGTKDIFISASKAYLLYANALIILNISDPINPNIISRLDLEKLGWSIFVEGEYAYSSGMGFDVIDIGDPYHPTIVGSIESLPGGSPTNTGLIVAGDYAYTSGLQVIDISDPANPSLGSSIMLDEKFRGNDIQVTGTNAFVVGKNARMMVVDLIDPAGLNVIGSVDLSASAKCIHIAEDYAYIATFPGRMKIVDITQPMNPKTVGNFGGAGHATDIGFHNNYLFTSCEGSGIQILNVSDPNQISNSGFIDIAYHPRTLYTTDSKLFTLDDLGLKIFDISDPLDPVQLGSLMTEWKPIDVFVSNNYAYVTSTNNFTVIDVSDPQHPIIEGFNDQIGSPGYAFNRLFVSGSYAYLPSCNVIPGDGKCGYLIIDISDPQSPNVINFIDTVMVSGIDVIGTYAYLACTDNRFQIADLKDPYNPKLIGSISGLEIEPEWVKVSDDHAFIIGNGGSFSSINVSDPQNPYIVDSLVMGEDLPALSFGRGSYFEINGNMAYIGGYRITVIDISDPNNLVLIDALPAF